MSLIKIEQVKKDRGFTLFDLIIYGVVLLTVVITFIIAFTAYNREPLSGIRIYVAADVVFEYEFGGKAETYSQNVTVEEDEKGITVTISRDRELNVVYIDKNAKSAKMKEANCNGRQCLYFRDMNNNSDFIYCNPHAIKIEPLSRDLDDPNIIF